MRQLGNTRLSTKEIDTACMYCKKIKNSDGSWQGIRSTKKISHGICPDCLDSVWKTELATMGITALATVKVGSIVAATVTS